MIDFGGKVALVAGGASGIGRAVATGFAKHGALTLILDVNVSDGESLSSALRESGGRAYFRKCDISWSADVADTVGAVIRDFGRIDCFVNSAGTSGAGGTVADGDEAGFDHVIGINLKGAYLGLRHVLPVMLRQRDGAVVNIASLGGLVAVSGNAAYSASKHAVIGLTKAAAGEVARNGVRVNALCPGFVDTPMLRSAMGRRGVADMQTMVMPTTPMARPGAADEMAAAALFLCSDLASYLTGSCYVADGGRLATAGTTVNAGRNPVRRGSDVSRQV